MKSGAVLMGLSFLSVGDSNGDQIRQANCCCQMIFIRLFEIYCLQMILLCQGGALFKVVPLVHYLN